MQSPNLRQRNLDMLYQHAVDTNYSWEIQTHYPSMHSTDKLSWLALQNMHHIKEAAKTQNSRQADTAK